MNHQVNFDLFKSNRKNKRYVGIFYYVDKTGNPIIIKKTHFGQQGGSTYIDHNDDVKKKNYIARHQVNENWDNFLSSGSLARYILWNKKTLTDSIRDYQKRFNLL